MEKRQRYRLSFNLNDPKQLDVWNLLQSIPKEARSYKLISLIHQAYFEKTLLEKIDELFDSKFEVTGTRNTDPKAKPALKDLISDLDKPKEELPSSMVTFLDEL